MCVRACACVWLRCCYNFVYQMVGDGLSLGGFFLLAWAPAAYSILGMCFEVTRPMSAVAAARLLKISSRLTNLIQLAALSFGVLFAMMGGAGESDFQSRVLGPLFTPIAIATLISSTLTKYLFTTMGGLDVMMVAIAE